MDLRTITLGVPPQEVRLASYHLVIRWECGQTIKVMNVRGSFGLMSELNNICPKGAHKRLCHCISGRCGLLQVSHCASFLTALEALYLPLVSGRLASRPCHFLLFRQRGSSGPWPWQFCDFREIRTLTMFLQNTHWQYLKKPKEWMRYNIYNNLFSPPQSFKCDGE